MHARSSLHYDYETFEEKQVLEKGPEKETFGSSLSLLKVGIHDVNSDDGIEAKVIFESVSAILTAVEVEVTSLVLKSVYAG